ncbi:IspD/TarI family cytidylyltransferase [Pseudonocardia spinosispora]|uniref:IspD/TarI family cytidylyltransferase n=1 Tax=Pseudonocardia spinosispora TaxID=103441 RepID=UPI00042772E6|nr:2-C-methyl-D-erythritol 4-phosphate cytidylyltransferase [Pseudonocardia spinosispora]
MSVLGLVLVTSDGAESNSGLPGAFVHVAGVPLVVRAVRMLLSSGAVDRVILAVPKSELEKSREIVEFERVDVRCCDDGSDFWSWPDDVRTVVVHEARRPLAPPGLVAAVVEAAAADDQRVIVPVLPVSDTIKEVDGAGVVLGTVDRSRLWVRQTPAAIPVEVLRRALAEGACDLAALLDAATLTVPGDPLAFEVRTPWDLELAELLLVDL